MRSTTSHDHALWPRPEERTMTNSVPTAVVAAFPGRQQAEAALGELHAAGFRGEEVGWAMLGEDGSVETPLEHEAAHTAAGAASGALSGGVIGGLGLAAVSLLIPGVGPIIGGGMLATRLRGAAPGAGGGGPLRAPPRLGVGGAGGAGFAQGVPSRGPAAPPPA